jgi:hypothetical protein
MKCKTISKMHLTPKGFVPNRFKILEYRGKMPLPPIVMEISMINKLIINSSGSGFQPRFLCGGGYEP